MGQAISSTQSVEAFVDFTNLPKEAIESLWASYNLLGESWGLSKEEVLELFQNASFLEHFPRLTSKEVVGRLFDVFDTDRNGLVDAIELLVSIALASCMDTVDKLFFVFNAYDFNSSGSLCYDELSLLLRSAVKGLQKVCPDVPVFSLATSVEVEAYADLIFASAGLVAPKGPSATAGKNDKIRVTERTFTKYCSGHLVVGSWLRALASFPPKDPAARPAFTKPLNLSNSPAPLQPLGPTAIVPFESSIALTFEEHSAILSSLENNEAAAPEPAATAPATATEQTPSEETKQQVDFNKSSATARPRWMRKVDLMKPDEQPFPRRDDPDEVFEPLWVFGCNTARSIKQRAAQYLAEVPAAPVSAEEGGEAAQPPPSLSPIVYSAGSQVVVMKKAAASEEEGGGAGSGWTQDIYTAHQRPISALQVSTDKTLLATGDDERIILWEANKGDLTLQQKSTIPISILGQGVILLDISASNSLLLAVYGDAVRTLQLYDIKDKVRSSLVYSLALLGPDPQSGPNPKDVLDARFSGSRSGSLFAVCSSDPDLSLRFFSDSNPSSEGQVGMRSYEEAEAIYSVFGENVRATRDISTALARFQGLDEIVAGTNSGHITLWRGRICVQMIENAHKSRVTALDYNQVTLTLVSAALDGSICVISYSSEKGKAGGSYNFLLRKVAPPQKKLEVSASFDLLRHDLTSHQICAIAIPDETIRSGAPSPAASTRALVLSNGGDLLEVSLKVDLPEPVVAQEAPAEGDEAAQGDLEGAVPEVKVKLGDDVNGRPIMQSHRADMDVDSVSGIGVQGAVTCVARLVPGGTVNGFVTGGGDSTVRLWQTPSPDRGAATADFKMLKCLKVSGPCGLLDVSSSVLAVTLSGSTTAASKVQLYSVPDLAFLVELNTSPPESPATLVDIRFSPEGNMLACASTDGSIYVFTVQAATGGGDGAGDGTTAAGGWVLKGAHPLNYSLGQPEEGRVPQPYKMDFTSDGLYLRVSCLYLDDFFLLDVAGAGPFGRDLTYLVDKTINYDNPPAMLDTLRNLTWASYRCPLNWDSKGLKALLPATNSDLSAIRFDRSNAIVVSTCPDGSFGVDRLPALGPGQPVNNAPLSKVRAHNGPVADVTFIEEGGAKLITVGRTDGLVRVWKVVYDTDEYEPSPDELEAAGGEEEAAAPEEEEEEEEGQVKLPPIYDSGEEEDLFDGQKLKEYLNPNFKFSNVESVSAVSAPAALVEGVEETKSEPNLTVDDTDSVYNADLEVDLNGPYSAVATWTSAFNLTVKEAVGVAAKSFSSAAEGNTSHNPNPVLPAEELVMDFVYGCSTRSTRNSVRYAQDGRIVYPGGPIGLVLDKTARTQDFCCAHADDITALDVHIGQGLAVTGSKGLGPIYCAVWSTKDCQVRALLPCGNGKEVHGVSAVCFSEDGLYVAAALQDPTHTLLVFRTLTGEKVAETRAGPRKVLAMVFGKEKTTTAPGAGEDGGPALPAAFFGYRLLLCGVNHFKTALFQPHRGTLTCKTGGYGAGVKKVNALCCMALPLAVSEGDAGERVVSGNEFLLGMADGTIAFIARGDNKVSGFLPTLKGPVTATCVTYPNLPKPPGVEEEGSPPYRILVAGINGQLKVLDPEGQPLKEFNLYKQSHGLYDLGRVRGFKALCVDKLNRKVLYGTAAGELGEIDLETGADINSVTLTEPDPLAPNVPIADPSAPPQPPLHVSVVTQPFVSSHFRDQLHALCAHPFRQECITAGDDKTLRVWDLQRKAQLAIIELPDIARTATYSPNGHIIVLGLGGKVNGAGRQTPRPFNGRVLVVSNLQGVLRIVHTANNALDTVTSVVFSPDGSKVYASSLDFNIYVYDALNNFILLTTLTGTHTEGVESIDVSNDGKYLLSVSVSRSEVVLWDLMKIEVVAESARVGVLEKIGIDWRMGQCPVGLHTLSIYPVRSPVTDVWSVAMGRAKRVLASADAFGRIKFFSNPGVNFQPKGQGDEVELLSPYKSRLGHSPGGVSRLSFSPEDQYLLSAGRSDRCLIQWRVEKSTSALDQKEIKSTAVLPATVPPPADETFESSFKLNGVDFSRHFVRTISSTSSLAQQIGQVNLTGVMGVGNFFPASNSTGIGFLPAAVLCGQGDVLSSAGRLPLLVKANGQVRPWLSTDLKTAALCEQVSALTSSPCGRYVLVGQNSSSPDLPSRLLLLAAPSGSLISILSDRIEGGVTTVAFSSDNLTCACLSASASTYHSLSVFWTCSGRWNDAQQVGLSSQVSPLYVSQLTFLSPGGKNPDPSSAVSLGYSIATAGEGQLKWWSLRSPNLVSFSAEQPEGKGRVTSLTSVYGEVITGDSIGELYIWKVGTGRSLLPIGSHGLGNMVSALRSYSDGFVSASCDSIIVWKIDTERLKAGGANSLAAAVTLKQQFSLSSLTSQLGPSAECMIQQKKTSPAASSAKIGSLAFSGVHFVSSLSCDASCQRLLISTTSSLRMVLSTDSGRCERLGEGHAGAVVALLAHPTDPYTVFTLCQDGCLRAWDIGRPNLEETNSKGGTVERSLLQGQVCAVLRLDHVPTAMVFVGPSQLFVAVAAADQDGRSAAILEIKVEDRQTTDLTRLARLEDLKYDLTIVNRIHNVGTGQVRALSLSANARTLLASSQDGKVYMYRLPSYNKVGTLTVSEDGSVAVRSADFSADDKYIRTFSDPDPISGKVSVSLFNTSGGGSVAGSVSLKLVNVDSTPIELFWIDGSSGTDELVKQTSQPLAKGSADYFSSHDTHRFIVKLADPNMKASAEFVKGPLDEVIYVNYDSANIKFTLTQENNSGIKVTHPLDLENLRESQEWMSCSDAAAPEVRAISYSLNQSDSTAASLSGTLRTEKVTSVSISRGKKSTPDLICAGYDNGNVQMFRYPATSVSSDSIRSAGQVHSRGPVFSTFVAQKDPDDKVRVFVSVGAMDGVLAVWKLRV